MSTFNIIDAIKALEMGRDQLFYWIKTKRLIKPEIEGKGRGSRSKFSLFNIFELAVIQELTNLGFELNFIKEIINAKEVTGKTYRVGKKERFTGELIGGNTILNSLFGRYQTLTEEKKSNSDFFIMVCKDMKNRYRYWPFSNLETIKDVINDSDYCNTMIIVNVWNILRRIEKRLEDLK